MVGVRGFEPPAPASRKQCSTRLSYTPPTKGPRYSEGWAARQDRGARAPFRLAGIGPKGDAHSETPFASDGQMSGISHRQSGEPPHEQRARRRLNPHVQGHQGPARGALRGLPGPDRSRRLAPAGEDDRRDPRTRRAGRRRISHVAVLREQERTFCGKTSDRGWGIAPALPKRRAQLGRSPPGCPSGVSKPKPADNTPGRACFSGPLRI